MEYLAKTNNIIKGTKNMNTSQNSNPELFLYNKSTFDVKMANTTHQKSKYPEVVKDLLSVKVNGEYLSYNRNVCAVLNYHYLSEGIHGGEVMKIGRLTVSDNVQYNLTTDDINFISKFNDVNEIISIYIFKHNNYLEYWFEVEDNTMEVEDEIVKIYESNYESYNINTEILVFDNEELYEGTHINYDLKLEREG